VIGASELSDDNVGKIDRLKWKLAESARYRHIKNSRVDRRIRICTDNGSG
jgi:hypothetical protein